MTTHDVPTIIGFALIPFIVLIYALFRLLATPNGVVAAVISMGLFAVLFCIGSAMMHANFGWLEPVMKSFEHGMAGLGKGLAQSAPWIGGALLAATAGYVIVRVAPEIPERAWIPISIALIAVGGFGATMIFAKTENLIVIAVAGVVLSLIIVVAYLGHIINRRDAMMVDRYPRAIPPAIQYERFRGELLPEPRNKTNLPAKTNPNPFEKWS